MVTNVEKKTNLLIFGDSIVFGRDDTECGGWVNRLRLYFENLHNSEVSVFNLGISGQVSGEILDRFEQECNSRTKTDEHTKLVFAIGINDTQVINGVDRVSQEQFESNLNSLIQKAWHFSKDLTFVGLTCVDESRVTPFAWNSAKCCYNHKISNFDSIIKRICQFNFIKYIKTFDILVAQDLTDGIHPNSCGHQKLFEVLKRHITILDQKIDED